MKDFTEKTKTLIDSLKGVCAAYGLGNDGNEFKIITQAFTTGKVVLVDASKLGETIKDGKNQRTILRPEEEKRIVDTFHAKQPVEDFAVVLDYDAIKEKNYSLSAGQYFDIKIEYTAITPEAFKQKITDFNQRLNDYFAQGKTMETAILDNLKKLIIAEK